MRKNKEGKREKVREKERGFGKSRSIRYIRKYLNVIRLCLSQPKLSLDYRNLLNVNLFMLA